MATVAQRCCLPVRRICQNQKHVNCFQQQLLRRFAHVSVPVNGCVRARMCVSVCARLWVCMFAHVSVRLHVCMYDYHIAVAL